MISQKYIWHAILYLIMSMVLFFGLESIHFIASISVYFFFQINIYSGRTFKDDEDSLRDTLNISSCQMSIWPSIFTISFKTNNIRFHAVNIQSNSINNKTLSTGGHSIEKNRTPQQRMTCFLFWKLTKYN